MKVFKELHLILDGLELGEWLHRAAPYLTGDWRRSVELERGAQEFDIGDGAYLCFELHNDPAHSPVVFVLSGQRDQSELEVINIVSGQKSELSHDEYNSLLERFAAEVIAPSILDTHATYSTSQAVVSINDLMPPNVAELLRRFSNLANKSTGSSHPSDQGRWFEFIIAAHRSGRPLGVDRLGRWLVEDGGWSSERAHDLVIEFEQATALLSYYDRHARG